MVSTGAVSSPSSRFLLDTAPGLALDRACSPCGEEADKSSRAQPGSDAIFQFQSLIRPAGVAATLGLQLWGAAARKGRDAAQIDITRRSDPDPDRKCRRRIDACAGRGGNDD